MRLLIQLAGRVQRHRQQLPQSENVFILSKNYKALMGNNIAYEKPGFESGNFKLANHDLTVILNREQFTDINAIPRIMHADQLDPGHNWIDLEHFHLQAKLFGPEIFLCFVVVAKTN